ncbi:MAG: NADH-quinone oxidoreductase subunit A [Puniceicoccales bacterium]|jgi:NADH-quinone oxidoreductase subunit A|nr:NADH-quinone oxidoreductase subunit A [Puniceicoccales bacterium]
MDNSLHAHLPILIQVTLGAALPAVILAASHLFGQRVRREARHPSRDEAYECGIPSTAADANPHPRRAVGYCTAAMLFILFDVEAVFLIPWALGYRELAATQAGIAVPSAMFMGLLAFGLLYEHRRGAFEWDRPQCPLPPKAPPAPSPAQPPAHHP